VIRKFKEVQTWGTVIVLEAYSKSEFSLEKALDECETFLYKIDDLFSTFKPNTQISQLRQEEIAIENCDKSLVEVWDLSQTLKTQTNSAFDPWSVKDGVDFSGIVKGWAADKCCEIFSAHDIKNCLVNAAGDISVRGKRYLNNQFMPWKIGIRDPRSENKVLHDFELENCAIATSGTYEKAHIIDPYTKLIAIGSSSASVIGPSGAVCEALATALVVAGETGGAWFKKDEFKEYSAWVIDRSGEYVWSTKEFKIQN
jgi:thiamine biosynthesis lipoprotein